MVTQYSSHMSVSRDQFTALDEYDLFNPTISIRNCIYMNFRINLTQFYINLSRQEHQI